MVVAKIMETSTSEGLAMSYHSLILNVKEGKIKILSRLFLTTVIANIMLNHFKALLAH